MFKYCWSFNNLYQFTNISLIQINCNLYLKLIPTNLNWNSRADAFFNCYKYKHRPVFYRSIFHNSNNAFIHNNMIFTWSFRCGYQKFKNFKNVRKKSIHRLNFPYSSKENNANLRLWIHKDGIWNFFKKFKHMLS